MEKYKESDVELIYLLLNLQEETSPIRMSIGFTGHDGIVHHGIVLHQAAPKVINTIIKNGYTCDMTEHGLMVYKL